MTLRKKRSDHQGSVRWPDQAGSARRYKGVGAHNALLVCQTVVKEVRPSTCSPYSRARRSRAIWPTSNGI